MNEDLWKFKKTTNKRCSDCGRMLSIRERDGVEILHCSNCGYWEHSEAKRIRRKEPEEEKIVEPPRKQFRPVVRRSY